jgi:hypothetical protein
MRKSLLPLLLLVLSGTPAGVMAQFPEYMLPPGRQSGGSLRFGPGVTTIADTTFLSFTIEPELAFGKLGFGLRLPLLYNPDSRQIRRTDWNSSRDYARLIRYLRWGVKRDPLYARIGELTNTQLGHGFVVYYYNNNVDLDYPKRGLQFDLDFKRFGFETLISNLGRQELYGGRGYVRPLQFLASPPPIVRNLALGATFITDRDARLSEPLNIVGLDIEQPLLHVDPADVYLYLDWSNIADWAGQKNGHGFAYGVATDVRGIMGLFEIGAKFELRDLSEGFAAGLINPLYDIKKAEYLAGLATQPATSGWLGELVGTVLGRVSLRGRYSQVNESGSGDQFLMHVDATRLVPGFTLQGYYAKQGIRKGSDVWKLDENAMTIGEFGYRPYPFMTVLMRYTWSYVWDPGPAVYRTQRRFEPRVEFGVSW